MFRKPPVFLKVSPFKRGNGREMGAREAWQAWSSLRGVKRGLKAWWPAVLQKGDEVQCEIEEIGVIVNKVV